LPGEGSFGIHLAVSNARGFGADAPKPGCAPDMMVELDTTKPVAELTQPKLGPVNDSPSVDVSWTADDKNFGPEPIDLYYSVNQGGPWTPIAKGIRNDGKYRWYLPPGIGAQAYVRLVATDLAGNSCRCDSTQPLNLDDGYRPIIRITGVESLNQK